MESEALVVIRFRIRFNVWLVSRYVHVSVVPVVLVILSIVIVPHRHVSKAVGNFS